MIAQMSRVEILCLRSELDAMVDFVQDQGTLHLEEVPLVVEGVPGFLHRIHLTDEQKGEMELLTELRHSIDELLPLLDATPVPEGVLEAAARLDKVPLTDFAQVIRKWSRELRHLIRRRLSLTENIEVLQGFLQALHWVEPLVRDRQVELGKTARAIVLRGVPKEPVEHLRELCLEKIGYECDVLLRKVSRTLWAGVVVYPEEWNDAVERLLHDEGVVRLDMPEKKYPSGRIGEVIRRLDEDVTQHRESLSTVLRELSVFTQAHGASIAAARLLVQNRLARFEAMRLFAQSRLLAVIHGWMPSESVASFTEEMEKRFAGCALLQERSLREVSASDVPTLLRNHRLLKPFEVLLSLFKPPAYGSIDPTPLVAVAFLLFYGFILGDVLYGLVVTLLSWGLRSRFLHHPVLSSACTVGMYMGLSGTVFGVLFGEYGGNLGEQWFGSCLVSSGSSREPVVGVGDPVRGDPCSAEFVAGYLSGCKTPPRAACVGKAWASARVVWGRFGYSGFFCFVTGTGCRMGGVSFFCGRGGGVIQSRGGDGGRAFVGNCVVDREYFVVCEAYGVGDRIGGAGRNCESSGV